MASSEQISVRGVLARPPGQDKISIRDLLARSLSAISVQALYKSSLGKIYVRDLLARSLQQDLYAMSLYKVSIRGVLARSLYKISIQDIQDLYVKPLHRLSRRVHLARFMQETWQDLCADLCKRCLGKTTWTRSLYRGATLREPTQSKCRSTFHKSHFTRKFTGKMPRPRLSPERGHTHIVPACAVEMHVNI